MSARVSVVGMHEIGICVSVLVSGDTGAVAQRAALDQVRRALLTAPRLLREGGPAGGGVAHESVGDLSIAREAWLQELGDVAATR